MGHWEQIREDNIRARAEGRTYRLQDALMAVGAVICWALLLSPVIGWLMG